MVRLIKADEARAEAVEAREISDHRYRKMWHEWQDIRDQRDSAKRHAESLERSLQDLEASHRRLQDALRASDHGEPLIIEQRDMEPRVKQFQISGFSTRAVG
jgi:hypothetical protein